MKRMRLQIISLLTIAVLSLALPLKSGAADVQTNSSSEITALRSEMLKLKAENQALRKENQSLREKLAAKPQQTTDTTTALPNASSTVAPAQQQTGYWLTISSGIRHNRSCRYYMNSKGRFCGPNEGRACKLCGG